MVHIAHFHKVQIKCSVVIVNFPNSNLQVASSAHLSMFEYLRILLTFVRIHDVELKISVYAFSPQQTSAGVYQFNMAISKSNLKSTALKKRGTEEPLESVNKIYRIVNGICCHLCGGSKEDVNHLIFECVHFKNYRTLYMKSMPNTNYSRGTYLNCSKNITLVLLFNVSFFYEACKKHLLRSH